MAAQIPPHCPTRWPAGLLMVRTRVVFCHRVLPSNTRCNCCAFYSQLEWWPSRRVNSRRTSLFITKISQRSQGQTTKQKTPPALAKTAKRWLSVQVSLWLFLLWLNLLNLYCLHQQNLNSSGKPTSNSDGPKFPGDKSSVPSNNNQQKKGIQVLPDGRESTAWPRSYKYFSLNSTNSFFCTSSPGRVTNIPVGMVTDQFGMIGLLTFIRAAETDPGMVHLALGSDLTTLGLNLNSPEYDKKQIHKNDRS